MKTATKTISTLISILLLYSCASLTKSQLNEVNQFGQLTSHFSAFPGKVVSSYNQIHQQQELFRANSLPDPESNFQAIVEANDFKQKTDLITPKIDLTLKVIDQYAQGLILLTSDKHSKKLDTAAQGIGTNLDGLITQYNKINSGDQLPTGIGSAIAALITLGGDAYIRSKQADDVLKLVPQGDIVIAKMTDNIMDFLNTNNINGGVSLYLSWP